MYSARIYVPERPTLCGSSFDVEEARRSQLAEAPQPPPSSPRSRRDLPPLQARELEGLDRACVAAVEKILDPTSEVHAQLQAQGRRWAQHVLESPYSQARPGGLQPARNLPAPSA